MSKITVNAVLTVLRLVITLVTKCIRMVYTIMDLVDDGCLNSSSVRPDWMIALTSALEVFRSLSTDLSKVEEQVYVES